MFTRAFDVLSKTDTAIAGGKGASLGEMMCAGIPVPPGFVVLAGAFERFLEETDIGVEVDAILHTVNHKEMHTVENASEKIQALILAAQMPKDIESEIKREFKKLDARFVAVRSSATAEDSASAAWAGQLDSFLNTTEKDLLQNVQKCWASLFTPRAIFYRFELEGRLSPPLRGGVPEGRGGAGFHSSGDISVAVVVQKMVESEVSGIAFSVHPVTEDRNQVIIEAGFGLGEAIVSGQITPDSYVVHKTKRFILDKNISAQERALLRKGQDYFLIRANKQIVKKRKIGNEAGNEWVAIPKEEQGRQKLSDAQILELSEVVLKIEKHYGFPCDIEWALEKGKFYILQSRPITTLLKGDNNKSASPMILGYKDIDWAHYLSRPKEFFLTNILVKDFKGTALKKALGFGHDYWLFLYNGGKTVDLYRRVDELQESDAFMRTVITEAERVRTLFAKGRKVIQETEKVIKMHKAGNCGVGDLAERYAKAIQQIVNYFVYAVEIPYIIGGILETDNLTSEKNSKWILKECQFFRGLSHYPDFYEHVLAPLTAEVAKVIGAIKEEIMFITADEIRNFLDGKLERKDILKRASARRKRFVAFAAFGKEEFISAPAFLKSFYPKVPKDAKEIKGNVGYKGKVKGKVTIVFTKADFEKFHDGDILVTIQSNPSFMPVIAKSRAIVADEGGIMSHAAIVSRELRKPCIIGTKIATKVLKDGDMVEVDADKGIVRILQSRPITTLSKKASEPIIFKKVYSRDTAMMIEEGWFEAQTAGLRDFIGQSNPHYPVNIFCVEDGVLEIWENEKAVEWNKRRVLSIALSHPERILETLQKYRELSATLKALWNKKVAALPDVEKCFSRYLGALRLFTILYFVTIQEEVPQKLRSKLLAWRAGDDLMDGTDRFLRKAGRQLSLPLDSYAVCILRSEVAQKSKKFYELLKKRKRHWTVLPGEIEFVGSKQDFNSTYPRYRLHLEETEKLAVPDSLCGSTAFEGYAKGRVRILKRKDQIEEVKQGDIIVSPMTIPDFLPAMQKAAAFVTDEGGITCHAAIVARELKKPCIIGTKIATKVLKDGDLVEVNANEGVVTIIKKSGR